MDQVVLAYGNEEYVKKMAKKGSETDINYYNTKIHGNVIAFLYPYKFPERIQPLINAASVANKAILNVDSIDKSVGEFMLVVDYYQIPVLGIVSNDEIFENLQKISRTMKVNLVHLGNDYASLENFVSEEVSSPSGNAMVIVDQSFQVKGVGTVVLGFVLKGEIKKHQQLKAYPSGKNVEIRSIQIMDVEQEGAKPFSRIGFAIKNAEPEEVSKGTLLYQDEGIEFSDSIRLNFRTNPSIKIRPQLGEKVQLNFLFNNVNAEVSDISEDRYLIDTERKVPVLDIKYSITSLNSVPRISGAGRTGD